MKNTAKSLFAILLILLINSCKSKSKEEISPKSNTEFQKAMDLYPSINEIPKHEVLTFGTFHFDRSRDGSDIIAKEHIDITTDINQKELNDIIAQLIKFNPRKIAVEWRPHNQKIMDSLYNEYKKGNYELGKHETFQIGFRIAKKLGHSRVYCIDNNPPFPDYINNIDDWENYADSLGHLKLWKSYDIENKRLNTYMDTIQRHLNVYDYLKIINSQTHTRRIKQLWTTGLVNVGHQENYLGADVVARWYKRNIRLFSTAKNLVKEDENLLIIYGGAHKWILDELFEASPDFQIVQFNDLIDD